MSQMKDAFLDAQEAILKKYEDGEIDYDEAFDRLKNAGLDIDVIDDWLSAADNMR